MGALLGGTELSVAARRVALGEAHGTHVERIAAAAPPGTVGTEDPDLKEFTVATLATLFGTALSNIEPGEDAENAQKAHKQVSDVLKGDERLQKLGVDPILIGSYARDVSIRRVKDVDVFVRLRDADENLRPGDILQHTIDLLEESFPGQVTRQRRSAMVEFPELDLSVDVVIARPCLDHPDEHWQIPQKIEEDGRASWVETNPTRVTDLKTEANKEFLLSDDDETSGAYVRVVKLVRQVRRAYDIDKPGGFYFEMLTYNAFQEKQPNENTIAGYLTVVLRAVADALATGEDPADPSLVGRTIGTSATPAQLEQAAMLMAEAATLAEAALKAEETCESAAKWRELLGTTKHTDEPVHVFPLPEFCNADGSRKNSAKVIQGAPAVPAGNDRYA